MDGLLHVSEIANYRVKDVRDELKEGEQVLVKVINVDQSGKIRLSRKGPAARTRGPARSGKIRPRRQRQASGRLARACQADPLTMI